MIGSNFWRVLNQVCFLSLATAIASTAQTFNTLAYFDSTGGSAPFSSLVQGRDGNLYGTAVNGGASGVGSVFKVTPAGTLSILYSFCAQTTCADGFDSLGALALGIDGNFYGTTQNGGAIGLGTVFRITPTGAYTVLHSFGGSDGSYPDAGLVLGTDGDFYGTTSYGGANSSCPCGTVFKITSTGALTTLHSFAGEDGANPSAPLIQGTDGRLYGTTATGGTSDACGGNSCGTIFRVTPGGSFTLLHSFEFTDGEEPLAPLVQAANGAFYGTTFEGGNSRIVGFGGYGTIFKIAPGGAFSTTHKFNGHDGGFLNYGLLAPTDGNLYAESALGGTTGAGQILKITPPTALTTEYSFFPLAGAGAGDSAMFQATDGKFYATYGFSPGAVFSFDIELGPFVAFVIPAGKAGSAVQILGQALSGTTSITFNGVEATSFKVVSDTFMTAIVPVGATSGPVIVSTANGPLTSNIDYRVTK